MLNNNVENEHKKKDLYPGPFCNDYEGMENGKGVPFSFTKGSRGR